MTWVVFYDIRSNRNRTRIAKRLVQEGLRVQKSVFWLEGTPAQVKRICAIIAENVDSHSDSVCAWPLSEAWLEKQICIPDHTRPHLEGFVIG